MLQNRIYLGEIIHKDESYPGEHDAILDQGIWEQVQEMLVANRAARRSGSNASEPSLLGGLLFDGNGCRMTPSHASKKGRRYRYYISEKTRLPAREVESAVSLAIAGFLKNPGRLIKALSLRDDDVASRRRLQGRGRDAAQRISGDDTSLLRNAVHAFVARVELGRDRLVVTCSRTALHQWLIDPASDLEKRRKITPDDSISLEIPFRIRRRGVEARLILENGENSRPANPDPVLIRAIARAYVWNRKLISGEVKSIRALAKEIGVTKRYISRLLPLAFLAPEIVQMILAGRQPIDLTAEKLTRFPEIPRDWTSQQQVLDFA